MERVRGVAMPFRFYRRFGAGPFRINVSKGGLSYSIGRRGAWLTFGRGRVRETVGLPGTGLSWYQQRRLPARAARTARHPLTWLTIVGLIIWAVAALTAH